VFVLPELTGVIVHDRYQNYDAKIFDHLVHQLCVQHYADLRIMPRGRRVVLGCNGFVMRSAT
jgi:hypothetical protein